MARSQVIVSHTGIRQPKNESLGTSSTGACVIEIDLAVITNLGQLRAALNAALSHFAGQLPI